MIFIGHRCPCGLIYGSVVSYAHDENYVAFDEYDDNYVVYDECNENYVVITVR